MLRIAICDDLENDRAAMAQGVEDYLAAHPEWNGKVDVFSGSSDLLDALEAGGAWDIALLDVCMPGILGTQVARELRRRLPDLTVLFLTTSADYAVEAFALGAVHYLVKPFSQTQLREALDRAVVPYRKREQKGLLLHTENGVTRWVPLGEILYIESVGRLRVLHTPAGSIEERQLSLSALYDQLQALAPGQFITPYRGYIVNQDAIRTITAQDIQLHGGARVPLKEGDFRKTRNAYFQWVFEKGEDE